MKSRRRKGATLGLVAVCVLVVIIIGIGIFFLAKLFGGGREVANATDAGILNVAKNALVYVDPSSSVLRIPLNSSYSDSPGNYAIFQNCTQNPGPQGVVTLLTYNRCVGTAMLVALNAQEQGNSAAIDHANQTFQKLQDVGRALKSDLQSSGKMLPYFSKVAQTGANSTATFSNNDRMFGTDSGVASRNSSYVQAYMKPNGATNLWFNPQSLPSSVSAVRPSLTEAINPRSGRPTDYPGKIQYPGQATQYPTTDAPNPPSLAYMPGYQGFAIGGHTYYGVPVMPQQKPHLVSTSDFKAAQTAPDGDAGYTPPNAFGVDSRAKADESSTFGGAMAAAIVGAVYTAPNGSNYQSYDFGASLPGGYIVFYNPAGDSLPAQADAYDASQNIFNNELMNSNGNGDGIQIMVNTSPATPANNGGVTGQNLVFFANSRTLLNNWSTVNNGGTVNPYPSIQGVFVSTSSNPNVSTPATLQQCKTINTRPSTVPNENCIDQLNSTGQLTQGGTCLTYLGAMENAYGHGSPTTENSQAFPASTNGQISAIDYAKGMVIAAFNGWDGAHQGVDINATGTGPYSTGMGTFDDPTAVQGGQFPSPHYQQPLEKPNSIYSYITQIENSGGANPPTAACNGIISDIVQKAYQIQPNTPKNYVENLLKNTNLPMGKAIALALSVPSDPNSKLEMTYTPQVGMAAPLATTNWAQIGSNNNTTVIDGPSVSNSACSTPVAGIELIGNLVDVEIGGSNNVVSGLPADNNLHMMPYEDHSGANIVANESATWQTSSGFNNLLGVMSFKETVTGGDVHFSRPN